MLGLVNGKPSRLVVVGDPRKHGMRSSEEI